MTDFKIISLDDIKPDPNQPRRIFREHDMAELTQSIREKGVLQPILIRPVKDKKKPNACMLVCGERRWRSAIEAGLSEIPAMIRELSDEEALELQIVENLQRKDVHPMEEAVAFKSLVDKGKEVDDIAHRVGKSVFYVRQRTKLNSLIDEWQKVVFNNRISLKDALKVAGFDTKIQKELFDDNASAPEIEIGEWEIKRYKGDLTNAPFDPADSALNKKMGGCGGCQFNTATAQLFPGEEPICTNISCFKIKCDAGFSKNFEEAKKDPSMVLLRGYGTRDKVVEKAEKDGHTVYEEYSVSKLEKPEAPDWEEFREDNEGDYDTPEELKAAFDKKSKIYEKELKQYEDAIAGGKYKKALMVTGNDRGKHFYVQLKNVNAIKPTAAAAKAKEEAGTLTAADIDDEISRIKENQKRSSELDENKVWAAIRPEFQPKEVSHKEFSQAERNIAASAIQEKLGFKGRDNFRRLFKGKANGPAYTYENVTDAQLRAMVRYFFLQEYVPEVLNNGFDARVNLLFTYATEFFPEKLQAAIDAQKEIYDKRAARVEKRIAELKEKKKELTKAKK